MTRHVVDINLAYTITKRKIYTNVEYNFHDRCTYLTLQAVFSFLGRQFSYCCTYLTLLGFSFLSRFWILDFATIEEQYTSRLAAFMRCKYVLFFGSEFSRHPEGLSFSGLSFRDTRGSEFFGSGV